MTAIPPCCSARPGISPPSRDFAGTVHFIFQPAEEGLGGARVMIEEGLFDSSTATPSTACTTCRASRRATSPSAPARCWRRRTAGRSPSRAPAGTARCRDRGTDPTFVGGAVHRRGAGHHRPQRGASQAAVLSVGHIHAGTPGSPNVIPSEVLIKGPPAASRARCATCSSVGWPRSPRASPGRRLRGGVEVSPPLSGAGQRRRPDQDRRRGGAR